MTIADVRPSGTRRRLAIARARLLAACVRLGIVSGSLVGARTRCTVASA
ncbi:hypothetical protein [Micromonospora zhanjiangensis]